MKSYKHTHVEPAAWDNGYRFAVAFGNHLDKDLRTKQAAVRRAADWRKDYPEDDIKVIDRKTGTVVG